MLWNWSGPVKILFRCSDDVVVAVDRRSAREFKALCIDEIHDIANEYPLPEVSSGTLLKIAEFCEKYVVSREHREAMKDVLWALTRDAHAKNEEYDYHLAVEDMDLRGECDEQDDVEKYAKEEAFGSLIDISNAADFLHFEGLLEVIRKAVLTKLQDEVKRPNEVDAISQLPAQIRNINLREQVEEFIRAKRRGVRTVRGVRMGYNSA